MGTEVDFLPAYKHKIFPLVYSISRVKLFFLPVDKHHKFLQVDTVILGACGQAYTNYPK